MFTECGKDDGKRGGTIGHSTGDESDTLKVCCKKAKLIAFMNHGPKSREDDATTNPNGPKLYSTLWTPHLPKI